MSEQDPNKKIVEIAGVKVEVDLRTAKVISEYRVGDKVKLLKKHYSDSYEVHPGVIVCFDDFKARPTITIAFLKGSAGIELVYLNADSKDVEIAPISNDEELLIDRTEIEDGFAREIASHETSIREIKAKREYFRKKFGVLFKDAAEQFASQMGDD